MKRMQRATVLFLRALTGLLCDIDDAALARVPQRGPLMVITNHVGLVEIPILATRLLPRPVSGFIAAERWQNPILRWLFDSFGAIPLHRGEADLTALRRGLELLKAGYILFILPEGTRSHDGRLQKAHSGAVFLALQSGAPLLPVAHFGSERLAQNVRRLRRTPFRFVVDARGAKVTREVRQQMVDEAMCRMAALLPAEYRGAYANRAAASERFLRPLSGEGSPTKERDM
jgi:1-acyl-sn-glycerol-3-phosphate acyltransferase